jgi:hypothetical protein
MHVTFLHGTEGAGGAVHSLRLLLPELTQHRVSPTLLVPEGSRAAAAFRQTCAAFMHELPAHAFHRSPRSLVRLRADITSTEPVAVIANTMSAYPLALAAPRSSVVGVWLRNSAYSRGELAILAFSSLLRRRRIALAPSKFATELVGRRVAWVRRDGLVLPNPVEFSEPMVILPRSRAVGIVTSVQSAVKGADFALEVIRIAQSEAAFTWRIFGVAPQSSTRVEKPLADVARAMERCPDVVLEGHPAFPPRVGDLRAILITSRRESFSRVAAESMMAGIPVVAPRHTAFIELLGDGERGWLYEPGDAAQALAALRAAMDGGSDAQGIVLRARRHVIDNMQPMDVAQQFARLLSQTVQQLS